MEDPFWIVLLSGDGSELLWIVGTMLGLGLRKVCLVTDREEKALQTVKGCFGSEYRVNERPGCVEAHSAFRTVVVYVGNSLPSGLGPHRWLLLAFWIPDKDLPLGDLAGEFGAAVLSGSDPRERATPPGTTWAELDRWEELFEPFYFLPRRKCGAAVGKRYVRGLPGEIRAGILRSVEESIENIGWVQSLPGRYKAVGLKSCLRSVKALLRVKEGEFAEKVLQEDHDLAKREIDLLDLDGHRFAATLAPLLLQFSALTRVLRGRGSFMRILDEGNGWLLPHGSIRALDYLLLLVQCPDLDGQDPAVVSYLEDTAFDRFERMERAGLVTAPPSP